MVWSRNPALIVSDAAARVIRELHGIVGEEREAAIAGCEDVEVGLQLLQILEVLVGDLVEERRALTRGRHRCRREARGAIHRLRRPARFADR